MFSILDAKGQQVGHGIRRADVPKGADQCAALLSALAESDFEPAAGDEHTVARALVDADAGTATLTDRKGVGVSVVVWARTRRRGQQ